MKVKVVIYIDGHKHTVGEAELVTKRDGTIVCVRIDEESEIGLRIAGRYPVKPVLPSINPFSHS